MDFKIDYSDMKKYQRLFRDSPRLLRPVTSNVLTSLAFDARRQYIHEINQSMIVRNRKFVEGSLQVKKARSGPIEQQIALAGSVRRPRFMGWEEQQKGIASKNKRAITKAGRKGNIRNVSLPRARLKPGNKRYHPRQFAGRTRYAQFLFMMRVLSTRKGGRFLLSDKLKIKNGVLPPGLYELYKNKVHRLQVFDNKLRSKRNPWMSKSNQRLRFSTNIMKKYEDSTRRIIKRYVK